MYQQVIVSPEIATSAVFRTSVLSKPSFNTRLRCVCIDEAHCISLWGGSFRPDYAGLSALRARIPSHVPFIVASATLPEHILDDIRAKLSVSRNAELITLTNARPNIALSVRTFKHSEESKADLAFLLPKAGSNAKVEDIDITLVYCNERIVAEDACDALRRWATEQGLPRSCIAFYHAKISSKRKREIEEKLRVGEIRILLCTDAVGMVTHKLSTREKAILK